MYNLIKLPKEELNAVIINTAAKKGMNNAIVEKDLWVCITLDYLFQDMIWRSLVRYD